MGFSPSVEFFASVSNDEQVTNLCCVIILHFLLVLGLVWKTNFDTIDYTEGIRMVLTTVLH